MSRLFVYGSLRSDAPPAHKTAGPAQKLLAAHAMRLGKASLSGRLHAISWHPGYVRGSGRVKGEVWEVTGDKVLEALDSYEGDAYVRERRFALLTNGGRVLAYVYRYMGDVSRAPLIESGDYVTWLRKKT